jgi:type IV secretion system protein TrbL
MNTLLSTFLSPLIAAYTNLVDEARWILALFITIEMIFFGLWWALGSDNRIVDGIKKILKFGFWIWLVTNFPAVVDWVIQSFITAGFRAVAYAGPASTLMDPSALFNNYFIAADPIFKVIDSLSWYNLGAIILFGLSLVILLIAYLIMAAQVFLTVIEFYIICAVALILLPFGVFKYTSFLGEKAIGALISYGVKFMVLALLLGLSNPVFASLVPPSNPDLNTCFSVAAASLLLGLLYWNAPGMAAGLLAGAPSLTAGTALRNFAVATMATGAVVNVMHSATRSAASGAQEIGGAAKSVYGAARDDGATRTSASFAALGGAARASASMVKSTMTGSSNSIYARNRRI